MAFKIVTTKRYENNLKKVLTYLLDNWSEQVAENFLKKVFDRYKLLTVMPTLGMPVISNKNVRSILITKHNKVYYRIEKENLVIINIFDNRRNPKKNPYNK